jgi:hypothetical protein
MKKVDFVFEESLREGKSRRRIITFDIDDTNSWKTLLDYADSFSEMNEQDLSKHKEKKINKDPQVWLDILKSYTPDVFMEGVEVGDDPDDYYFDNGPESEKYYFNMAK